MYPIIDIVPGVPIFTFGLALSISFLLFFRMLYKLSAKFGINTNFFLGNALWFFLSIFFFSRFFYIIAEWRDFKFIFEEGIFRFLFMSDFNFSLIGWIFWFFLVLLLRIKTLKLSGKKYVDASVLSFFFAGIIGFLGALLGGQIYGTPTESIFGISMEWGNIPYSGKTVPLALVYAISCFTLFSSLYIARTIIRVEWLIGYVWIVLFCCILFIGEFYNGNTDIFESYTWMDLGGQTRGLNMNQLWALVLMAFWIRWFYKIHQESNQYQAL